MRRFATPVVLAIALVLAIGCSPQGTSDGGGDGLHSVVPSVTGLSLSAAEMTLDDAGYVIGTVGGDVDDPEAVVVEQSPIASTSLPWGGEVDLVVAAP